MIDNSVSKKGLYKFKTISDLNKALGVSRPLHPLITLIRHEEISPDTKVKSMVPNFYMVSYKTNLKGKLKYGQAFYDFDEGGLIFVSPNQALSVVDDGFQCKGISLFFHPDFLNSYPLGRKIKKQGFFSYNINEALHLSEKEKLKIIDILEDIEQELNSSIDEISQDLIISYIEVLLNYSNRYFKRQFITRKVIHNSHIEKFEELLTQYFGSSDSLNQGLPSVAYFSDKLNISSSYLSDMLRNATGLSTKQHIQARLVEKAKEMLASNELTAAQIAYDLGFEHPQSFNKFFKIKTGLSPIEFRQNLN